MPSGNTEWEDYVPKNKTGITGRLFGDKKPDSIIKTGKKRNGRYIYKKVNYVIKNYKINEYSLK